MKQFKLIGRLGAILIAALVSIGQALAEEKGRFALAADYGDFSGKCRKNRPPGTKTKLYFVPIDEIDTWPALKTTTDPGDSITLDGDIVLDAVTTGKGYWRTVDIVADTGQVMTAFVGERGGKSWDSTLNFFLPGTATATREWIDCLTQECNIALVPTRESPTEYVVYGSPDDPAEFETVELDSGLAVGDRSGTNFSLKDVSGNMLRTYAGTLDLTPNP